MPFLGSLQQASPYTLEVVCSTPVAITVVNIRRDRISEVESLTFDSTTGPQSRTVASNIGRLVFIAGAAANGTAMVKVSQGTNRFEVPLAPDGNLTFDIA